MSPLEETPGTGDPEGGDRDCAWMLTLGFDWAVLLLDFLGKGEVLSSFPAKEAKNSSSVIMRCGGGDVFYSSYFPAFCTLVPIGGRSITELKSVTESSFYVGKNWFLYSSNEEIVDQKHIISSNGDEELVSSNQLE